MTRRQGTWVGWSGSCRRIPTSALRPAAPSSRRFLRSWSLRGSRTGRRPHATRVRLTLRGVYERSVGPSSRGIAPEPGRLTHALRRSLVPYGFSLTLRRRFARLPAPRSVSSPLGHLSTRPINPRSSRSAPSPAPLTPPVVGPPLHTPPGSVPHPYTSLVPPAEVNGLSPLATRVSHALPPLTPPSLPRYASVTLLAGLRPLSSPRGGGSSAYGVNRPRPSASPLHSLRSFRRVGGPCGRRMERVMRKGVGK